MKLKVFPFDETKNITEKIFFGIFDPAFFLIFENFQEKPS